MVERNWVKKSASVQQLRSGSLMLVSTLDETFLDQAPGAGGDAIAAEPWRARYFAALQRLRANRGPGDTSNPFTGATRAESLVLSVIGSRGGVGTTSLAVNLGCSLAADKHNRGY